MACGNWLTIQKQLSAFNSNYIQVVWAIFDCNREQVEPRFEAGEEWSDSEEDVNQRYATIFTYAAKLGEPKPELEDSTFSKSIA